MICHEFTTGEQTPYKIFQNILLLSRAVCEGNLLAPELSFLL